MKKLLISVLLVSLIASLPAYPQVGKFLKNVGNSVKQDLLGTDKNKPGPEPPSACSDAELVFEVGKYKIDYSELQISVLDDGRVLCQDKMTANYYIINKGVTEGPIKYNDPRVKQFENVFPDEEGKAPLHILYKDYITKQNGKYTVNFGGKSYGPYGSIEKFEVSSEKDKFAALVVENIVVTADEGKKMDEAMKNAKTDQEKMDLAMQYSQQMQQKIMAGGGPQSMTPKLISNIPGVEKQDVSFTAYMFSSKMKYNEIVMTSMDGVKDLTGKLIISLPFGKYDPEKTFISSDNTKYAVYDYGTLTISDGRKLAEMFNPHFVKADGKLYLAYMYFSPKRNAIMQCKIPF